MPKKHHPRRGSLQFWPRKRAKKILPSLRLKSSSNLTRTMKDTKLPAFIGYKAGMTHLLIKDTNQASPTKNQDIFCPVTVIDCPPLKSLSLRFYKKQNNTLQPLTQIFSKNLDKELKRKIKFRKKESKDSIPEDFDDLRLVVYTQPKLTPIGKKKPEIIEIPISGKNKNERLEYAKQLLDKEIKLLDIFNPEQLVDIRSITKGKGFQGTVKRFGVTIRQHKSEKTKRGAGNLGPWTPKKVSWRVPQPGKMGFHKRTEYNKLILNTGSNPNEINPKGGFLHYGLIKNDYLIVKGSIPGPTKRTILLTNAIRPNKKHLHPVEINYISQSSKQGK